MPYILEPARSGRSRCKGKCKEAIPQDEWRLGSVIDGDYAMCFWRCLPCVTQKQCRNILEVYASFEEMMAAQGVTGEEAELLVSFFNAKHDGEEAIALALANALNGHGDFDPDAMDEASEEEEEEEAAAPVVVRKKPKKAGGGKGKKAVAGKAAKAATVKKEAKETKKATAAASAVVPRLSHGEWEAAVLTALAGLGGEQRAAAVHELVEACLGEAVYKKGQVTGALGRLEGEGLVEKKDGADEDEPAEEGEGEGEGKKKRKKKPVPVFSLTAAGRARLQEEEADGAEGGVEAVVEEVKAPAKKKAKKTSSGGKGKGKVKKEEEGTEAEEKKAKGPTVDSVRLARALSERFYCLQGALQLGGGGGAHPAGAFSVLSMKTNKASVYEVAFRVAADAPARRKRRKSRAAAAAAAAEEEAASAAPPALKVHGSCTCPDARMRGRTSYCKHQLFVAVRVLGIDPADLREGEGFSVPLFEAVLSSPRLAHLRLAHHEHHHHHHEEEEEAAAPAAAAAAAAAVAEAAGKKGGVPQKPLDEDAECGVCFEPMVQQGGGGQEALSYCTTCGNSVHTQCFGNWKQQAGQRYGGGGGGANASCVYCRATGAVVPV